MTTCANCQHWSLQKSPLARSGAAPCALKNKWEYLPQRITCAAHKPLEQAATEARLVFLAKIDKKHNKVTT
jgi:hypothetical protein